jgi:hypothetical protein
VSESVREDEGDVLRQWAEVEFTPDDRAHRKDSVAPRYLAVRLLKKQGALFGKKQGALFGDGSDRKHFAVVTHREGDGLSILRWHRAKAGTVEHVHDILKNDLAAAALPSQKSGANAAWFRANVILANLFVAMRAPFPKDFQRARPKRLRFEFLNTVGRVIAHARQTLLRLVLATVRRGLDLIRTAIGAALRPFPGD